MRQIGTLPESDDPQVFSDYLLSIGISSRALQSPEGWAIWVHNEDHVPKAREELAGYQENPDDPRYLVDAKAAADAVRREKERLDRQYRKNVKDLSGIWGGVNLRRRPLTMALVGICVALYLAGQFSDGLNLWLHDRLLFFSIDTLQGNAGPLRGLDDILVRKEVWRLITPVFLHGGILHLVFNMWVILDAGTLIESRRGTRTLLGLFFLSAVVSNLGQFLLLVEYRHALVPWVGISGVAFAMFGYIWMKGQNEPDQGMRLHPSSVRLMLLWLILGFTDFLPLQMANGAHVAGLVAGMLFGLARF